MSCFSKFHLSFLSKIQSADFDDESVRMKIRWELPGRDAWLTSADVPIILTDQYHTCAVDCLAALAKTIVSKHSIELPPV